MQMEKLYVCRFHRLVLLYKPSKQELDLQTLDSTKRVSSVDCM